MQLGTFFQLVKPPRPTEIVLDFDDATSDHPERFLVLFAIQMRKDACLNSMRCDKGRVLLCHLAVFFGFSVLVA